MAENRAAHDMEMERLEQPAEARLPMWGQWLGLAVALGVLILAAYMAYLGSTTAAAVVTGVDLVGLAAVFVLGSSRRRRYFTLYTTQWAYHWADVSGNGGVSPLAEVTLNRRPGEVYLADPRVPRFHGNIERGRPYRPPPLFLCLSLESTSAIPARVGR